MQAILMLQPLFFDKIWGGTRLKSEFHYPITSQHVGECWAISGLQDHDSMIMNGPLAHKGLRFVYQTHPELFYPATTNEFPLLTKIIDATDNLSVQVHPDDCYAQAHHLGFGKSECWYILKTNPSTQVIYGHTAPTKDDLKTMIASHEWNRLLRKEPIRPGDFINVPAGTIHAICDGTLLLETQQSSDTTFRLYDYDRLDQTQKHRPLHLEEAIDVTTVPSRHEPIKNFAITPEGITELIKTPYFTVEKWVISSQLEITQNHFLLVSVIDGEGKINKESIQKGSHFIITSSSNPILIDGNMDWIVSYVNEKR